jgi:hypothetical protein
VEAQIPVDDDLLPDEEEAPPEPDEPTRMQATVWPLFLLSLLLMGIGIGAALMGDDTEDDEAKLARIGEVAVTIPDELDRTATDPVHIVLDPAPGERPFRWRIIQRTSRRRGDSETSSIETRMRLDGTDALSSTEADDVDVVERSFTAADVILREGDRRLNPEISELVESFVREAEARFQRNSRGKITDFQWTSSTNEQIRQTLSLLADSTRLFSPHVPDAEVRPGESWSWSIPLGDDATDRDIGLRSQGTLDVTATFLGTIERDGRTLAVIEHDFRAGARGQRRPESDEDEHSPRFDLQGEGHGLALFDPERHDVSEHRLELELTTEITGEGDDEPIVQKSTLQMAVTH